MITIVIPTLNRSDFVIRTLRYYAEAGFTGSIIVGDSSGPEHRLRLEAFVAGIRGRLEVTLFSCPELNDRETLHRLATMVQTPYVAFIGDDDFLVVPGLQACAHFLDAHPDFVAANGLGWAFTVASARGLEGVYGKLEITESYPQPEFLQAGPVERFAAHMADYRVTLFSLHRAAAWREMWHSVLPFDDRAFGAELLPSVMSPVLGRTKHLDCLYLLRQSHPRRYQLPNAGSWLSNPRWRRNYMLFRDLLAERLSASARLSVAEAAELVEGAFVRGYLAHFPERDRYFPSAAASSQPGEPAAVGMPRRILRRLYWEARTALSRRSRAASAKAAMARLRDDWLEPGSEHHAAFAPVHRIIANPPTRVDA